MILIVIFFIICSIKKGKFDIYLLCPFRKNLTFAIVAWSTVRSLYGMRENPFNFDQCAEIIWPHCKCASDLMDVIGVSSPLLSVNFMQRKNPGIFLTCFAKRPKIDDIPRDKLFIIIEWLWKISLKNIVSSLSRTSQTSDFKKATAIQ